MAGQSVVYSDLYVSGTLAAARMAIPSSTVTNTMVAAGAAGSYIAASKLEHQFCLGLEYAAPTGVINAGTKMMHIVRGATGEIVALEAAFMTVAGATTQSVALDLRKVTAASTGATVLSAVLTLASTDVVRTPYTASLSSVDTVDGDQLHLVVTTTGSTVSAMIGLLVSLTLREDPV